MASGGRTTEIAVFVGAVAVAIYLAGLHISGHPQVETQYGVIQGERVSTHLGPDAQVEQFLGIPFALPPVGERRFMPPQPPAEYRNGFLSATEYPKLCLQIQMYNGSRPMDEDCLYLNVYRPASPKTDRAVMVWVHGGAFVRMYDFPGYTHTSNATILANLGDVIVVTIHYRLGIFGSLHTGDDRIQGGNFGMRDQQMALRWVHENIAAFGGDPSRVTLFGQSAGGHSVSNQLLMQDNQQYFARAIIESGSSTSYRGCLSLEYSKDSLDYVAETTGCSQDDPDFVDCLRKIPARELLKQTWHYQNILKIPYVPAADGDSIPADKPINLLHQGRVLRKDILIGINQNEGTVFVGKLIPDVTMEAIEADPEQAYNKAIDELVKERVLNATQVQAIRKFYAPADYAEITSTKQAIGEAYGDVTYKCPVQEQAIAFKRLGMKVYQYYLTYSSSIGIFPKWMGVAHSEDVQWVFGHPFDPSRNYKEEEKHLSLDMIRWWTNFAKYGFTTEEWKTHTCEEPAFYSIDGPDQYVMHHNSSVDRDICILWGY